MRSRYKIVEEGTYFVTSTLLDWVDLFSDEKFANIIIEELKFRLAKKELQLYAYVIMPDHFHLIISSNDIRGVMRRIKSYTAKRIIQELVSNTNESNTILKLFKKNKLHSKPDSKYQVWQEGYHPKLIMTDDEFGQKIYYIHNNPVKKGFVKLPEEWKYSSYRNYYGFDELAIEFELPYSY